MPKNHLKSVPLFVDVKKSVDKEKGIIKGITIVQEGLDKDFGYFNKQFLKDLTKAGNDQTQGVKCRFDHPAMCKTTLGSYIGRYKNFKLVGKSVKADLHLDPITKKTEVEGRGITMYDYIVEMSSTNPDMFGNSIHFFGPITHEEKEFDGGTVMAEVYQLKSFYASDLVDMPAATESLFKDVDDLGMVVTKFLDNNPEIFQVVQKDESVIFDFLKRYDRYINLNNNKKSKKMNFLKTLQKQFSTKKDIEITLADGTIANVVTDADVVEVGDIINDEDGKALPDGDHLLPDGTTFQVEGGKITDIFDEEGEEEDEMSEDDIEEVSEASTKALMKGLNTLIKSHNETRKDIAKSFEFIANNQTEMQKKQDEFEKNHNTLAKSVTSKKKSYTAEPPKKTKKSQGVYDPEKVKEERKRLKKKKQ